MLGFNLDDQQLSDVAAEYDATPKQVDMAQNRAVKRTAKTLGKISRIGLRTELGLKNAQALKVRLRQYKVGNRGNSLKLWYGANDLPLSSFKGRPTKVAGGVKIGDTVIHGAFLAKIGGRQRAMVRNGPERWKISPALLPVADRMMVYLEEEVFVDVDNIYFKHFVAEIKARTMLGVANG